MNTFEQMIIGYKICALWSSTNENGEPLDDDYSIDDIDEDTAKEMAEDCRNFAESVADDFATYCAHYDAEQFGHDFWLTRNGHGAGFWNRGLGDLGNRLTEESKIYGTVDLYAYDGEVYRL